MQIQEAQTTATENTNSPTKVLAGGVVEIDVECAPRVDRTEHRLNFVRRVDVSKEKDGSAFLHVLRDTTTPVHHLLVGFVPLGGDTSSSRRDPLDHYAYIQDLDSGSLWAALGEVAAEERRVVERARAAQGMDPAPVRTPLRIPQKVQNRVRVAHEDHQAAERHPGKGEDRQPRRSSRRSLRNVLKQMAWKALSRVERDVRDDFAALRAEIRQVQSMVRDE